MNKSFLNRTLPVSAWQRLTKRSFVACFIAANVVLGAPAVASECDGNPDALGISRTIAVDPFEHSRVGTMQYPETLPLADHEIVLTFDDGPSPRYTDRILATLADKCVKATFFMVGEMAKLFPEEAKKVRAEGHTIGTHSFGHPFTFGRMNEAQAGAEIDKRIQAVTAALGGSDGPAPFFRVPGFLTSKSTEAALASRKLMTWSADVPADDWKGISSAEIEKRAIDRIEQKGRGILLLHDIHEQTVGALPNILSELKRRGYRIVQIVPASATITRTETTPEQWQLPRQHSPEAEQGSKQQLLASVPGSGDQTAPASPRSSISGSVAPDINKPKLALDDSKNGTAGHLSTTQPHHRCDQRVACGAAGCHRDGTAKEGKNARVRSRDEDHSGCSVSGDGRRKRLSARASPHRGPRHANQNRQDHAAERLRADLWEDGKRRAEYQKI
jgi:peptidoglycan/xylan/chitin deacetylase (PgdA/CDA1 family)